MTAPAEQRVRHRRRVTGRRAVIGSVAALALTGGAVVTTSLLSTAGAAAIWPTAKGSRAVSSTIEVSGTYDGKLKKFFGKGALGSGSQDEDQDPVFELADGAVLENVVIGVVAPPKAIVGVNANHGDTATLSKIHVHGDLKQKVKTCVRFKGNSSGKEPTRTGVGADGTTCKFSPSAITYK